MPTKTFVNLEKIQLTVKRTHSVHLSQRKIDWDVTFDLGPLAEFCTTPPVFTTGEAQGKGSRKQTTEDKLSGTFTNELTLPPFGGVLYEVTATRVDSAKSKKKLTAQYVAWRKIYYTLNYMNDRCKALVESTLADVQKVLDGVFIQIEQTESHQLALEEEHTVRESGGTNDIRTFKARHIWKNQHPQKELLILVLNDICSPSIAYPSELKESLFTRASSSVDVSFDERDSALRIRSTILPSWAMRDYKMTGLEFAEAGTAFLKLDEAALKDKYTMKEETPELPYFDIPLDNGTFRSVLEKVLAHERLDISWTPGDSVGLWAMALEDVSRKSRIIYDEDRKVLRLPMDRTARERKLTALKIKINGGATLVDFKVEGELTGKYEVTTRRGQTGVYFTLPLDNPTFRSALQKLRADQPVNITMRNTAIQSIAGYHTKDTSVIVVTGIKKEGEPPESSRKRTLYGFLHEFGHAIGMVRDDETRTVEAPTREKMKNRDYVPPKQIGDRYFGKVENPLKYTGQGGTGTHCKTGSKEALEEGIRVLKDEGKVCIMHHAIAPSRMEDFCPNCKAQITRNEVKV